MKTVDNNSSKKTDLEGEKRKREDDMSGHERNVQPRLYTDVEQDNQGKKRKRERWYKYA